MNPKIIIGQGIGILLTLLCIATPQFKKKWQMALCAVISNMMSGANFLLLGQVSSCGTAVVAVLQATSILLHIKWGKRPKKVENIFFLLLYIAGGFLPYLISGTMAEFGWIDFMPIPGSLLLSGHLVQEDEQRMRWFLLANVTIYTVYDILVVSTQVFAHGFTFVSVILALIRYRKKQIAEQSKQAVECTAEIEKAN